MNKEFILRRFDNRSDAQALFKALDSKRVVRHMASDGFTLESCKEIVKKSSEHWQRHGIGDYVVLERQTGRVIGWSGFKLLQEGQFELLVVLSPDFFGMGFKIYLELMERAKNEFGLKQIYILYQRLESPFTPLKNLALKWLKRLYFKERNL